MNDFKQLKVWQKAHSLTLAVYEVTRRFPKEELYGLTSQLRRSAASIGANIAEGCGRRSDGEMNRYLQISRGSAVELEYHLLLSHDLHLVEEAKFIEMTKEIDMVQRMLTSLMESVRRSSRAQKMPSQQAVNQTGTYPQL